LPTTSIALAAASLSPTFQVRINFSTAEFAPKSAARACDMPASPAALATSSLTVPPIRSTWTVAKPARRTRKLRTNAKPPNTRGRTPIHDIMCDNFMGIPAFL
jgi:hypothetical protein